MKFLHLADLHLGKSIHGISLIDHGDQVVWVERFLEKVRELQPDAIVIAGDVYDRSAPSGDAVTLLDSMLTELETMKMPVMIIAGNHDSGQRLSFGGGILSKQNIYIAGIVDKKITHVSIPDKEADDPVNFWLMPYLFPALVAQKLEDESITDYHTAIWKLLEQQNIDYSQRNILVAHQNITANGSEAQRGGSESMVGGIGQIDYTVFDGFDYVALGHIHSSYPVGRKEVRYAGSPLCYHFDETKQPQKGPLLVEIGKKGTDLRIDTQVIEPLHRLREIKGTFDEIRSYEENNRSEGEYLRIVITDRRVTPEIADYLREFFKKRDSMVLELVSDYHEYKTILTGKQPTRNPQKKLEDYFEELYRERRIDSEPDEKDMELFHFIGEQVRHKDSGEWNKKEKPDEQDVEQLLAFVLDQEA